MTSETTPVPAMTATLTNPHTDPYLHVTIGATTLPLRVDLARVITRATGPVLFAVVREAARLLRRHTGCVPDGKWARTSADLDTFTVGIREIPGRCETCVHGCDCQVGHQGCAHLGCRGARTQEVANSCPGVVLLTAPARQMAAVRR